MKHTHILALTSLSFVLLVGCSAEARRIRAFERAGKLQASGQLEEAKIEYLKLLRQDPASAVVNERLGLIWMDQGDPIRALPFLIKVRELQPENHVVRTKLAAALITAERIDEARAEALAAVHSSTSHEEALLLLSQSIRTRAEYEATLGAIRKSTASEKPVGKAAHANVLLATGNVDEAEKLVLGALKQDPRCSDAHAAMAAIHFRRGEQQKGREAVKAAAECAPARSLVRARYAEMLASTGLGSDAKEYLGAMIKETPDYAVPRLLLARILIQENSLPQAEKQLNDLFRWDPSNVDGHLLLVQMDLARNEQAKALERLEALEKAHPALPGVTFNRARLLVRAARLDEAAAVLRDGMTRNPEHLNSSVLLGEILLRTGKPAVAVQGMAALLTRYPQNMVAQTVMIKGLLAMGRLDDAASVTREQIRVLPNAPEPHVQLGNILQQQGKTAEARASYEEALKIAPESLVAIAALVALELKDKNQTSAALERLDRIIAANPENLRALTLSAIVRGELNQPDKARADYEKLLAAKPDFPLALNNLAYLCAEQLNDLDRAFRLATRARELEPTSPVIADTLGWILFKRKDYQAALPLLKESAEKLPNNDEVKRHLALATEMAAKASGSLAD